MTVNFSTNNMLTEGLDNQRKELNNVLGIKENRNEDTEEFYSKYDDDNDYEIELSDMTTNAKMVSLADKNYENSIKDSWIKDNLKFNADSEYKNLLKSMFKQFQYKNDNMVGVDGEVESNLVSQADSINQNVRSEFNEKVKALETKRDNITKNNEQKLCKFQSDLNQANEIFNNYKASVFEGWAENIGDAVWDSDNTAEKIQAKLESTQSNIKFLASACAKKDVKSQESYVKGLENENILSIVNDYISSNKTGASTIKTGICVAASCATGNAAAGFAVGAGLEAIDKRAWDYENFSTEDVVDIAVAGATNAAGGIAGNYYYMLGNASGSTYTMTKSLYKVYGGKTGARAAYIAFETSIGDHLNNLYTGAKIGVKEYNNKQTAKK